MQTDRQDFRKAKRAHVAERRALIAKRYLTGMTQPRIARELNLAQSTVCEDIKALIVGWERQANIDIAAHIAIELKRINYLEMRTRESFEKSCLPKRIASFTKREGASTQETVASATEIQRPEGDPRFLMVILKCIDLRIKLLRLDRRESADDAENKPPMTFSEFMAAHLKQREQKSNGTTPKALPPPVRLKPGRLP